MDWASNVQPDGPCCLLLSCYLQSSSLIQLDSERYYGKDAVCPEEYEEWLHSGIITEQLVPNQPGNLLMNLPEEVNRESRTLIIIKTERPAGSSWDSYVLSGCGRDLYTVS